MKTIIFGFSRPKTWKPFAKAIMWLDSIPYDHAFTMFPGLSWGVNFIYQQSGLRTNFMSGTLFDSIAHVEEQYELDIEDDIYSKIGNLCVQREGISYGILQVIGKGLVRIVYLLSNGKLAFKNPFRHSTDCIEEQALILNQCLGISVSLDMNTITVKPYRDFIASIPGIRRTK